MRTKLGTALVFAFVALAILFGIAQGIAEAADSTLTVILGA